MKKRKVTTYGECVFGGHRTKRDRLSVILWSLNAFLIAALVVVMMLRPDDSPSITSTYSIDKPSITNSGRGSFMTSRPDLFEGIAN